MTEINTGIETGNTTFRPIRVMLVDDHVMVLRGLATFMRVFDDLQLVGEAKSGEAAIQLCAEVSPDVILMDMVMPDMDGATATRAIRQKFPQVRVLALTSFTDVELIKSALDAGVIGYLLKDISAEQLEQAIRAAVSGEAIISVEVAQRLVEAAESSASGLELTEFERETLALMTRGLNKTQISEKLAVSPNTVQSIISEILFKLSIACHTEVVTLVESCSTSGLAN